MKHFQISDTLKSAFLRHFSDGVEAWSAASMRSLLRQRVKAADPLQEPSVIECFKQMERDGKIEIVGGAECFVRLKAAYWLPLVRGT
jgi:hypothetical protein